MGGDGNGSPSDAMRVAQSEADMRSGFVNSLRATSTVSSFAALAAGSTGQVYIGLGFVTMGYASDRILVYMGELQSQVITNNVILDAGMIGLTNRYPVSGGIINIGAKTLVNQ